MDFVGALLGSRHRTLNDEHVNWGQRCGSHAANVRRSLDQRRRHIERSASGCDDATLVVGCFFFSCLRSVAKDITLIIRLKDALTLLAEFQVAQADRKPQQVT